MTATAPIQPAGGINHTKTSYWSPLGSDDFLKFYDDVPATGNLFFEVDAANLQIKADTIAEVTAANGVVVDGATLKDGQFIGAFPSRTGLDANTVAGLTDSVFTFANTANRTLTLPDPATVAGKIFYVAKTTANNNEVAISPDAGLIVGNHNSTLYMQGDSIIFFSDGTNYQTIGDTLMPHVCQIVSGSGSTVSYAPGNSNIQFDQVSSSNNAGLDDVANDRILIKRPGDYFIYGYIALVSDIDDTENVQIQLKDNAAGIATGTDFSPANNKTIGVQASTIKNLAVGRAITASVSHNHGSNVDEATGEESRARLIVKEVR